MTSRPPPSPPASSSRRKQKLSHAVFGYVPQCASGRSRIFTISHSGKKEATVEICLKDGRWTLNQMVGPRFRWSDPDSDGRTQLQTSAHRCGTICLGTPEALPKRMAQKPAAQAHLPAGRKPSGTRSGDVRQTPLTRHTGRSSSGIQTNTTKRAGARASPAAVKAAAAKRDRE